MSEDLLRIVAGFGAPFGYERSAKFVEGALLADRCLMSLHRAALGGDPVRALSEAMAPPPGVQAAMAEALEGATHVHFGHEAEPGFAVRKLYFEYSGRARGEAALLHLAYKWRIEAEPGAVETRYVWRPCRTRAEARERVAARAGDARGRAAALALLDRVHEIPAMLDVEEAGGPRVSLDINLYDARLTLGAVAPVINETAASFGVEAARVADVFGPARDKALGHVATGTDRAGRGFVTFYFGVEGRRP
jgi:tryptophan halogenase